MFFGSDVDESVEAEKEGTVGWGSVCGGIEDGEERGGEVVGGAGGRGGVAEERGTVHATGGHGGRDKQGNHTLNIELNYMYDETLR